MIYLSGVNYCVVPTGGHVLFALCSYIVIVCEQLKPNKLYICATQFTAKNWAVYYRTALIAIKKHCEIRDRNVFANQNYDTKQPQTFIKRVRFLTFVTQYFPDLLVTCRSTGWKPKLSLPASFQYLSIMFLKAFTYSASITIGGRVPFVDHPVAEGVLPDVQPRYSLIKLHGMPSYIVYCTHLVKELLAIFAFFPSHDFIHFYHVSSPSSLF